MCRSRDRNPLVTRDRWDLVPNQIGNAERINSGGMAKRQHEANVTRLKLPIQTGQTFAIEHINAGNIFAPAQPNWDQRSGQTQHRQIKRWRDKLKWGLSLGNPG
jgi:hypothetical protein